MYKNLKQLEGYIEEKLKEDCDWPALSIYLKNHIEFFQHERLIHLIVTLSIGLFLLITVLTAVISGVSYTLPLAGLFLILFIPYIIHYYHLENGVQRLYKLYDEIEAKVMASK